MPRTHRTAELRTLAMHRVIADMLRSDPSLIHRARATLANWERRGVIAPVYAARWRELLDGPTDQLRATIVEDSERMTDLRQNSPLTIEVPEADRARILFAVHEDPPQVNPEHDGPP